MKQMTDVLRETLGEIDFDPAALKAKYLHERDKRLRQDGNSAPRQVRFSCAHQHPSSAVYRGREGARYRRHS